MKKQAFAAIVALCAITIAACGSDPTKTTSGSGGSGDTITIGSANFPENELLAEMYAQAVEGAGGTVNRKFNIGSVRRTGKPCKISQSICYRNTTAHY